MSGSGGDGVFETVTTPLDTEGVLDALRSLSRKGKLPGFDTESPGLFRVSAFSAPFDHHLTCHAHAVDEGTELRFVLERQNRMPILFAVVLAFTVWPGVVLTDSLLATWFGFYGTWSQSMPWLTYAWYLPLTAGPIPWMWSSWSKKSRSAAEEHGREQVGKVRATLAEAAGAGAKS